MLRKFACTIIALAALFSTTVMAGPDKKPGNQSIVDIAMGNPDFSILVDLVIFAELDDVLANEGQFTVFAPTNEAFEGLIAALTDALGAEAVDALLSDKAFVTDVLLYHVTDGRRFANSVVNRNNPKAIEMLNGGFVFSSSADPIGTLMDGSALTGDANIVGGNISASNGVIHIIDAVLVP